METVMNPKIIIPRKKSKSIGYAIGLFFVTVLMIFLIAIYFGEFEFITSDIPFLIVLLSILVAPICAWSTVFYFKQIFNENPVLKIDETGIYDGFKPSSARLIRWEDIDGINIAPYMDNVNLICVFLKNPDKYAVKAGLLDKFNKHLSPAKWGHIQISSLYFKKEFKAVCDTVEYYLGLCNSGIDPKTVS